MTAQRATDAQLRGVAYIRQSVTRTGSESLASQQEVLASTATQHGVTLVASIVEAPSTSAYKNRGRGRAKFGELLGLIRNGSVDVVLAYKSDRLSRGGGPGWSPLLEAAEAAGLDTDRFVLTPNGFMTEMEIGFRATMDREESRKTAERVALSHARRAARGEPVGGPVPFGWTKGREVEPEEGAAIRDAVERILTGESLRAVAFDWNARGLLSRRGKPWDATTLRQMLVHPRLVARRTHNGKVVADATWPPILEREVHAALVGLLDDPARRLGDSRARKYLLAGLLICGRCGKPLHCRAADDRRGRRYHCRPDPNEGCGRLSIMAGETEAHVRARVLRRLDSPQLARWVQRVGTSAARHPVDLATRRQVAELERRLVSLRAEGDDGVLDAASLANAERRLERRLTGPRDQGAGGAAGSDRAVLLPFAGRGEELRAAWDTLSLVERRAPIVAATRVVTVEAASRQRRGFDPGRVRIAWRR